MLRTIPLLLAVIAACRSKDYARELGPGESALRLVTDRSRLPDVAKAYRESGPYLRIAAERSLAWFAAPSSKRWYPFESFTHEQAEASVRALLELLDRCDDDAGFEREFLRRFDVYESIGYDRKGTVLFTGYYSPVFAGSRQPGGKFQFPLYRRPPDLVSDPITGEVKGRKTADGSLKPWPARREIERSGMLKGSELVWLADPLDAYIVHVNGSARIALREGGTLHVGYAGKTDRPYKGLGTLLVERKHLKKDGLSLMAIRRFYRENPDVVKDLILENESYVFFTEYEGAEWPAGSIGVPVTDLASVATDKKIFPRGGLVLFDTKYTGKGQKGDLIRFALDQDTGGAIRAPGRADIYFGIGPSPELLAGGQYSEGRLFYCFLRKQAGG